MDPIFCNILIIFWTILAPILKPKTAPKGDQKWDQKIDHFWAPTKMPPDGPKVAHSQGLGSFLLSLAPLMIIRSSVKPSLRS